MVDLVKENVGNSVWYHKYNPEFLEDVILPPQLKERLQKAIQSGKLPNLGLWSTQPGLGKSSTARALIHSLNADSMFINASNEKGIDVLRNKIYNFACSESFDDKPKVVVLDEADYITKDAQAAFRGFIDEYSSNCSFIFTGNYKSKMIEPLLNRLENYDFGNFKPEEMKVPIYNRLTWILEQEGFEITQDIKVGVCNVIKACYPSIRSMINSLERLSFTGNFTVTEENTSFDDVINAMREKDYLKLVSKVNALPNPDAMYEYLYGKISMFRNIPNAIIAIADGQFKTETVRDKNLNLCATLVNLMTCF